MATCCSHTGPPSPGFGQGESQPGLGGQAPKATEQLGGRTQQLGFRENCRHLQQRNPARSHRVQAVVNELQQQLDQLGI